MDKVYIVINEWVCDGEDGMTTATFKTKENTMIDFNNKVYDARCDKENWGWTEETVSGDLYAVWAEGEYVYNHIIVKIIESEVK